MAAARVNLSSAAMLAGLGLGVVAVYVLARYLPGILTGDNDLTRSATNMQGEPVTAYVGAGVLGTVGAAANAGLGGAPASFGQWIGSGLADLLHPELTDANKVGGYQPYTGPAIGAPGWDGIPQP